MERTVCTVVDTLPNVDGATRQPIHGIIGIINLIAGPYLIVITSKTRVGDVNGKTIYKVQATDVIPYARNMSHLNEYQVWVDPAIAQREENIDDSVCSSSWSTTWNTYRWLNWFYAQRPSTSLTRMISLIPSNAFKLHLPTSMPRRWLNEQINASSGIVICSPDWQRIESPLDLLYHSFMDVSSSEPIDWEIFLCLQLLLLVHLTWRDIPWPTAWFLGEVFIGQAPGIRQLGYADWETRFTSFRLFIRGIDDDGRVANYVETEQILQMNDAVCSYVQVIHRIHNKHRIRWDIVLIIFSLDPWFGTVLLDTVAWPSLQTTSNRHSIE